MRAFFVGQGSACGIGQERREPRGGILCSMTQAALPLEGRVSIVTGATAGIGLAIAEHLVKAGSRVIINARRAELLERVARDLTAVSPMKDSASCIGVVGDCADQAVIDQMLNTAKRQFGKEADLVVVNAGRGLAGSVISSDQTQWEQMIRTNILGAAALMRSAATRFNLSLPPQPAAAGGAAGGVVAANPQWLQTPRDLIVIGSVVGRNVSPFSSMYGGTKFAVHGMVEGVRRELSPLGIRVTLIAPGFVVSEFQQVAGYEQAWFEQVKHRIGPPLDPADVARAITFVAQQPAHVHVADVVIRPTRQDYP